MPITDMLVHNANVLGSHTALVEVNPAIRDNRGTSWREFELVETNPAKRYRRQMSWRGFNEQAQLQRAGKPLCPPAHGCRRAAWR